jgi:hypothetical protein
MEETICSHQCYMQSWLGWWWEFLHCMSWKFVSSTMEDNPLFWLVNICFKLIVILVVQEKEAMSREEYALQGLMLLRDKPCCNHGQETLSVLNKLSSYIKLIPMYIRSLWSWISICHMIHQFRCNGIRASVRGQVVFPWGGNVMTRIRPRRSPIQANPTGSTTQLFLQNREPVAGIGRQKHIRKQRLGNILLLRQSPSRRSDSGCRLPVCSAAKPCTSAHVLMVAHMRPWVVTIYLGTTNQLTNWTLGLICMNDSKLKLAYKNLLTILLQ